MKTKREVNRVLAVAIWGEEAVAAEERKLVASMGADARKAGKTLQDNPFRCGWERRVWIMGFGKEAETA